MREAAMHRPYSDIMPQLQANFAFTKAYLAERSGAQGGLPGPKFYVDLALLDVARPPSWIQMCEPVEWAQPDLGLSARFAAVSNLASSPKVDSNEGFSNGLTVARALVPSNDVLAALQTLSQG